MVTLAAVLQSQSVELAGNRCDPASKARHSGHSGVNSAAGAEQLLPWALMSAGGVESQASVHLFVMYEWAEHSQAWPWPGPIQQQVWQKGALVL